MIAACSKPTITKEQQNNVTIRIYKNYDIKEIEFLWFTKNESTGSYILKLRINNDEKKKLVLTFWTLISWIRKTENCI